MKATYFDNSVNPSTVTSSTLHKHVWVRGLDCPDVDEDDTHTVVTMAGINIPPPSDKGQTHCRACGRTRNIIEGSRILKLATDVTGTGEMRVTVQPRPKPAPRHNTVPAIGSVRRLQALALQQWPGPWIAQQLGMSACWVNELRCGMTKTVTRDMEQRIKDLCAEIGTTYGPRVSAATVGRRKGWVPLCVWQNIDDPDEQPRRAA